MITDLERAEHLRARADHHVAAERGVPLAAVLAGTAERHALIDGAVIADLRSLADDDGAAVVNEHAFADFRAGVDFNPGQPAGDLTDRTGGKKVFFAMQIMRRAVRQHGVQPGIKQQHLRVAARGGVAVADGADLVGDVHDSLSPRIDCFFRFFHPKGRIPYKLFCHNACLSMRGLRN